VRNGVHRAWREAAERGGFKLADRTKPVFSGDHRGRTDFSSAPRQPLPSRGVDHLVHKHGPLGVKSPNTNQDDAGMRVPNAVGCRAGGSPSAPRAAAQLESPEKNSVLLFSCLGSRRADAAFGLRRRRVIAWHSGCFWLDGRTQERGVSFGARTAMASNAGAAPGDDGLRVVLMVALTIGCAILRPRPATAGTAAVGCCCAYDPSRERYTQQAWPRLGGLPGLDIRQARWALRRRGHVPGARLAAIDALGAEGLARFPMADTEHRTGAR
jgi:hypothetical protein